MAETKLVMWICYREPATMVDWLRRALGFDLVRSFEDEGRDGLIHAELRLGAAVVVVQADHDGYDVPTVKRHSTGRGANLVVENETAVRAIHQRAVATGASSLIAPETTEWGNYRCELLDPEGTQWSIGTYLPGEPDGDW